MYEFITNAGLIIFVVGTLASGFIAGWICRSLFSDPRPEEQVFQDDPRMALITAQHTHMSSYKDAAEYARLCGRGFALPPDQVAHVETVRFDPETMWDPFKFRHVSRETPPAAPLVALNDEPPAEEMKDRAE